MDKLPLKPKSECAILFTSGSTGVPKGVIFTDEMVLPKGGVPSLKIFVRILFQKI